MIWKTASAAELNQFDWSLAWTIVAAIVGALALVGVVYAVVGYYRDHPKRQLEYKVRGRRLVQSTPRATLEVKVNGIEVRDPHLVEFRLVSNSRADIPSAAFDAGRSLTIRVEPGSAVVVGDIADKGIMTTGGDGNGREWEQFDIGPQLIRSGSTLSLDFISSGPPTISVSSPLIDVPVVNVSSKPSRSDVAISWFVFALSVFVLTATIVTPYTNPDSETPIALHWIQLVLFSGLLLFSTAFLRRNLRWRRHGG